MRTDNSSDVFVHVMHKQCRHCEAFMPTWVSKNGLFEPFMHKNDLFTKTGSGQT